MNVNKLFGFLDLYLHKESRIYIPIIFMFRPLRKMKYSINNAQRFTSPS